ncbi:MAG: PPC domain-containing protein [Promethearchaeota archaeon]
MNEKRSFSYIMILLAIGVIFTVFIPHENFDKNKTLNGSLSINSSDIVKKLDINVPAIGYYSFYSYRSAGSVLSGNFTIPEGLYRDIDFFICDDYNFNKFKSGQTASVYLLHKGVTTLHWSFTVPYGDVWHIVYDNSFSLLQGKHVVGWQGDSVKSSDYTLKKNEWVSQNGECGPLNGGTGYIHWSFSGTNNQAGIEVFAVDSGNFTRLKNSQSYSYYLLSNGQYYSASGNFYPTYLSDWSIVFKHVGPSSDPTNLSFNLVFYYDDSYEPNDDFDHAVLIGEGEIDDLIGFDDDWYKIYLNNEGILDMSLNISGTGDLDLYLYNSDESLLAWSSGSSSLETIHYFVRSPGYYYIKVDLYSGGAQYDLITAFDPDDSYEDNDNLESATAINIYENESLNLKSFDDDWFKIQIISNGGDINISISLNGEGIAHLNLYDSVGNLLSSWSGNSTFQSIQYTVVGSGDYYIKVNYVSGAASYNLTTSVTPLPPSPSISSSIDGFPSWLLILLSTIVSGIIILKKKSEMEIF